MNSISRHISYLLLTCRKVSVSGLGTFSASYEPASFDSDHLIFYPARIRINFTGTQEKGFVELSDSLKRQRNLKDLESIAIVNEYVTKIRQNLNKNRFCRLDGIGYLFQDEKKGLYLKDTFWKQHRYPTLSARVV